MPERAHTVTLSEPGPAGSYIVAEHRDDGSLVLRPESVEDIVAEFADRPLTEDQQEEMFRRLDNAGSRAD